MFNDQPAETLGYTRHEAPAQEGWRPIEKPRRGGQTTSCAA